MGARSGGQTRKRVCVKLDVVHRRCCLRQRCILCDACGCACARHAPPSPSCPCTDDAPSGYHLSSGTRTPRVRLGERGANGAGCACAAYHDTTSRRNAGAGGNGEGGDGAHTTAHLSSSRYRKPTTAASHRAEERRAPRLTCVHYRRRHSVPWHRGGMNGGCPTGGRTWPSRRSPEEGAPCHTAQAQKGRTRLTWGAMPTGMTHARTTR